MKIKFLVFALVFFTGYECCSQNLIGIEKSMIPGLIKKEMKGLNLDKSAKNESFNYLKFINAAGTRTLLVFFDDKNKSVSTRLICDYSEIDFLTTEMNKVYKKTGENSWEYSVDADKFEINLEKKEWYFVVNTKKK